MKTLNDWYKQGLTSSEYIQGMSVNKEKMLSIYNRSILKEEQKEYLHSIQEQGLRALILTADWCGDAMVNIPLFMRIANEALIDIRYFIRDENLELMDQYLTNGKSRSIPIIVIIDKNGSEVATWGPRAPEGQELADELFGSLPAKGTTEFDEAFKKAIPEFQRKLTEDKQLWEAITDHIISTLKSNVPV
ncbi:thioredoxin family protein [Mesobacillus foraminis]|uniref:thioredoxin family protein n=1 Tax=Mesobacillus foraminis TaxID=279826 RepID=UPI0039A02E36